MTDLFPDITLGEALVEVLTLSFKCQAAVTKGQVVVGDTHTTGEVGSVSPASAGATKVIGVALKSGAAGELIPVCVIGVVKVATDSSHSAIGVGDRVMADDGGRIDLAPKAAVGDITKGFGIALQASALNTADELLILVLGGVS